MAALKPEPTSVPANSAASESNPTLGVTYLSSSRSLIGLIDLVDDLLFIPFNSGAVVFFAVIVLDLLAEHLIGWGIGSISIWELFNKHIAFAKYARDVEGMNIYLSKSLVRA